MYTFFSIIFQEFCGLAVYSLVCVPFELTFVKALRTVSRLIFFYFFQVDFICSNTICCKDSFHCFFVLFSLLCQRSLTIVLWISFQALYSVPLAYCCVLHLISLCFDYCSFTVCLEVGSGSSQVSLLLTTF